MNHQATIDNLQKADPILAQAIAELGNCSLEQVTPKSNLLEALAWAIVSQQISTFAANKIYQRFLSLYPEGKALEAALLLQSPEEPLRSIGISRYKVRYLKTLAQHIEAELLTLAELQAMADIDWIFCHQEIWASDSPEKLSTNSQKSCLPKP